MIETILQNIKQSIREIPGYEPPPFECRIKLNQNENPYSLPVEFKHRVAAELEAMEWGRYPSSDANDLKHCLSHYHDFPESGILVGNGSNELIQALALATLSKGDTLLLASPTFSLYKLLGSVLEARIVQIPLLPDFSYDVESLVSAAKREKPKLTILASPNNPTGISLSEGAVQELVKISSGFVAIDEAYIEFAPKPEGSKGLIERYPNLIVTRTYSKAMSAAGIRLGYMLANPQVAQEINKVRLPYNLGKFSRCAAIRLLEARDILKVQIAEIISQRERLFREMTEIPNIKVHKSDANFLLMECLTLPASMVFERLQQQGILVRNISNYPLLSRGLRVSVGTREENSIFLSTLKEIMTVR